MSKTAQANKKLAIIDGKSVFYRGYYAMPNLSTKDGTPTGGVFGFAAMALEVLKRLKPDYVCVAWDKPKTNIRKRLKIYSEYKAGRKPAPPDFYEQIPILHELLEAFGWPLYELDDYEADDIMGTLAVQATKAGIETMLVTSDLDMLQIIDPHVHVFALKKGLSNIELYSPQSFEAKYGIKAEQFLDFKAIKGDSSDNIPGVPGIGEKGATDLIKTYKTLDGVYDNLPLIKASLQTKLEKGRETAYMSKELAAIWTDAPIKLDLDKLDVKNCEPQRIKEILQRLEFRSLARQLPESMSSAGLKELPSNSWGLGEIAKKTLVDSDEKLAKVSFERSAEVVVYGRCAGKHGQDPQALIISPEPEVVYVFDLGSIDKKTLASKLEPISSVIGYDTKATLEALLELGISLPNVKHDVLIGSFLLNSLRRVQTLTELAQEDIDYQGPSLDELDKASLIDRAAELMAIVRKLYDYQMAELAKHSKLARLATDIEWPVIPVLARMESRGIKLDTKYLETFSDEINDKILTIEQQIYGYADFEFNISSPAQLADVLFSKLNLPKEGIKKGKTGYSTAANELDKLRGAHPIIDLITQYREVTKLKNTYVDTLPQMVDQNSRLHTTFNLTIAQTGRLSSTDPNLQNIPVRTGLGRRIRTAFVADKGNVLISADYSQFELRLAAVLSKDQGMLEAFNNDADIHKETAAAIYGLPSDKVTKQMRYSAKAVNFGIMYGQGPHGLSVTTGMPFSEAKAFIEKYFQIRPKLKEYIARLREEAKTTGYVETIFGRRRPTPDVHSSNFAVREGAYRAAVNMPMQGTAADLMKLAMIRVQQELDQLGEVRANILLQIHDSILIECPEKNSQEVADLVKKTMQDVYKLPVKLKVDVTLASNWGEL